MPHLITDQKTDTVFFSKLVKEKPCYNELKAALDKHQVNHFLLSYTKDIWARDYMPIQLSESTFLQYRYQPDYLQDKPQYRTNPTKSLQSLKLETVKTDLIIDGGNVIKCTDSVLMTEKVFFENPNYSKIEIAQKLENLFECEIFFLPWDMEEFYGHADGMIRYLGGNQLLMNHFSSFDPQIHNQMLKLLGHRFDLVELHFEGYLNPEFNWAYINYLQVGNLVLLPRMDIFEDYQALQQFQSLFPCSALETIDVTSLVKDGGALNCISWNIKSNLN